MDRLPTAPHAPVYFVDGSPRTPTPPDEYRRVMSCVRGMEVEAEARLRALAARDREEALSLSVAAFRLETAEIMERVVERMKGKLWEREKVVEERERRMWERERKVEAREWKALEREREVKRMERAVEKARERLFARPGPY